MSVAPPQDVAAWAWAAGFTGGNLPIAIAVAYSETGANPAHAGGVWNVPGGPADGRADAVAAFARWKAGGWSQWATFKNGKYLLFMPLAAPAAAAVAVIGSSPAVAAAGSIKDAAGNLPGGDIVSAAQNALTLGFKTGAWVSNRHNWARVAEVIVGGALLVGALIMVSKPVWKPAADTVSGIARKAATKGAA